MKRNRRKEFNDYIEYVDDMRRRLERAHTRIDDFHVIMAQKDKTIKNLRESIKNIHMHYEQTKRELVKLKLENKLNETRSN